MTNCKIIKYLWTILCILHTQCFKYFHWFLIITKKIITYRYFQFYLYTQSLRFKQICWIYYPLRLIWILCTCFITQSCHFIFIFWKMSTKRGCNWLVSDLELIELLFGLKKCILSFIPNSLRIKTISFWILQWFLICLILIIS